MFWQKKFVFSKKTSCQSQPIAVTMVMVKMVKIEKGLSKLPL